MSGGAMWMGIWTIIAILVGPISAVLVTRYMDNKRADIARKLDVFRTLMRTRGLPLDWDHVGALNLVEVEFIKHPDVLNAWKEYLNHLAVELPQIEQKERHDQLAGERDALLTKLISEIAKVLKIKVEQLDILRGNYVPRGWEDAAWEERLARRGLIALVTGRTSIAVRLHPHEPTTEPYPPSPDTHQYSRQNRL